MSICLLSCLLCNGELIIRGNLSNFISTCLGRMKVWNSLDWVTCYPLHFTLAYIVYQESRNRQFVYIHVHYGVHGEMYIGIDSRLIDLSLCFIICSQIKKDKGFGCQTRTTDILSPERAAVRRGLTVVQMSRQFSWSRLSVLVKKPGVGGFCKIRAVWTVYSQSLY